MLIMHRAVFAAALALLAGCANTVSQRDPAGHPRLERLSAAEAEQVQASTRPKLLAEDLVRLSKEGLSPEELIDRYQQSGSRLRLSSAQLTDLRQRGVDARVLDYIVQHEREADKVDAITRAADRDAAARARRHDYYRDPWFHSYPYWGPRIYPYAGYGWHRWGGGWHGGFTIGF
jgi:hypothetical protein